MLASYKGNNQKLQYRTSFGNCPSRSSGSLALKLVKEFERNYSLRDIKKTIIKHKLKDKHFLSDYAISYNPVKSFLNIKFDCPSPLMKVQLYKNDGTESYEALLVSNGQLFDPTYEVLLRTEKKIKGDLPYLALPVGKIENDLQQEITNIFKILPVNFREKVSEIIISDKNDMTIILSIKGKPSSVFIGNKGWVDKIKKLKKIVSYLNEKKRVPAVINLTNAKKVVVKFSDKF